MRPENNKALMKTFVFFLATLCLTGLSARAQGTLVYDQQSQAKTWPSLYMAIIQSSQPFGQSFVPSLSSIDFIQLYINGADTDATIYVNLWSGSIGDGILLASTLPDFISGGTVNPANPFSPSGAFVGVTNFFFSMPVTLTPGTTYYFQPIVEPGAGAVHVVMTDPTIGVDAYPNGLGFINGTPNAWDLWFGEGVVAAPEPSAVWLILIGAISFCWVGRERALR